MFLLWVSKSNPLQLCAWIYLWWMFSSTFLLPQLRHNEQELFLFVKQLLLVPSSQLAGQCVLIRYKACNRHYTREESKETQEKGDIVLAMGLQWQVHFSFTGGPRDIKDTVAGGNSMPSLQQIEKNMEDKYKLTQENHVCQPRGWNLLFLLDCWTPPRVTFCQVQRIRNICWVQGTKEYIVATYARESDQPMCS